MRMRTTLLSPLALGAVVFAALMEPAVLCAAEPARLTGAQMDTVTAGAVAVEMAASAIADGPNAQAHTSTSTTVISTPKNIVDIGLGFGRAYACCGSSADTGVRTAYYAEGDIVIAHSIVKDTDNPHFSASHGVTTVIAINLPFHQ
jgi:hypothetical protein